MKVLTYKSIDKSLLKSIPNPSKEAYERLVNVFYDHLMEVYDPERIRLTMICNPRGGISSKLTIDSDWKVRGGDEKFADWRNNIEDTWSVTL